MDECYDDNDIINLQILEESTQTKNENVDESDPKLNSSDPKLNCSDPKLNSTPIVYTTRLEEMFVMNNNNFGEIFVKKALQDIETESKPRIGDKMYKMICKTNQPVHLIYKLRYLRNNPADKQYSLSHQEPLDTTRRRRSANTKEPVLTESFRLKNAKLLSLCKPLTIRLEKLVIKHVYNKTKPRVIMVNKTESKPIVFIMKDITANETDIYYIKNKVLKEHFKLTGVYNKIDEPYMSAYKRAGVETKKISFCCWQNRENYLSTFRMQEKKFMGKLHYCQNGKCTCCCAQVMIRHNENKDIVPEKLDSKKLQSVSDVEILDLEKEVEEEIEETKQSTFEYGYNTDWLKDLLSSNNSDTLINKALNYDPANKSVTNKNVSPSNEFASQQRETKEYIKNVLRRFDLNETRELEFYKFSEEGLLEMYVKEPQNSEPCFSKIFSKDMTCSSIRKDAICCWQKREHIIRNVSHDYPVLAKFLTAPHPCSPTQCKCCCPMYKLKKKLILKDISLSERNTPRHTQPYVNVTKMPKTNRRKNVHRAEPAAYLLEIPSAGINTLYADISNTLLESRYRQKPPRITYGLSDNVMGRPHKHTPSHTLGDATAGPSFSNTLKNDIPQKDKPTEINFQTTPTQLRLSKTMPNQKIISSPNVTAPVMEISSDRLSQAPSIDSMISSVLERFKDVRLTINEDGKVAAALNVPVNTLSTAELKVLANILAHAQEQVQAIGLANSTGVTPKIPDITECMRATANISNIGETHIIQSTSMPSAPPPPVQNLSNNFSNSNNIKNASAQESKKQLFSNFSEIMNDKNETFMASFTTYVDAIKEDTEDSHVPVISSVFSLKDKNLDKQLSSTLDAWSEGPENKELSAKNVSSRNSSTETHDTSSLKRTSETEKPTTAKIRVVDPSKLGITNNFEESIPSKTVKILNNDLGNSNNTQDFTSKMHVQGRIGNSIVTPNTLTDDPLYCTSNVTSDIGLLPTTIFVNPITNTAGNNEQVKQVFYLQSPQTANRASAPTNSLNYQKAFTNSPNYNNVRIMRPVAPGIGQGNLTTNPNRFEYRIENIDSASNLNCINLVPVTVTQANPAGTIPPPPLLKRSTRRKQTLKKSKLNN